MSDNREGIRENDINVVVMDRPISIETDSDKISPRLYPLNPSSSSPALVILLLLPLVDLLALPLPPLPPAPHLQREAPVY